jgi:hypothetical protein
MPLVCHIIERQGCGYIIKDDKNINERTWWHPKMKPKFKFM